MEKVYYGQIKCQAINASKKEPCKNGAYYKCGDKYVCGVHSRGKDRTELEKPTKEMKDDKLEKEAIECEEARRRNKEEGKKGSVVLYKMQMMKSIDTPAGYLRIFPNKDHGGRKDGIGLPSLSPFNLGPINHGYPNIPKADNLESFYQFSKIYADEVDKEGNPLPETIEQWKKDLQKPGERHKRKGEKPLYALALKSDGSIIKMNYAQGRKLYCKWYEKLAKKQDDYQLLLNLIKDGYNICICGYDGTSITNVEKDYKDLSVPFGHERVLYTMLTQDKYPWN